VTDLVISFGSRQMGIRSIDRPKMRVGRAGSNDIVLNGPTVSSFHAVISRDGPHVLITDLGSRNGVLIGGKRLRAAASVLNGHTAQIGQFTLKLSSEGRGPAYDPTLMAVGQQEANDYSLHCVAGTEVGTAVAVRKVVTVVGRVGEATALIVRRGNDFAVRSTDGLVRPMLNGLEIGPASMRIFVGDVLELGTSRYVLRGDSAGHV
jgi:hypothetical protein